MFGRRDSNSLQQRWEKLQEQRDDLAAEVADVISGVDEAMEDLARERNRLGYLIEEVHGGSVRGA